MSLLEKKAAKIANSACLGSEHEASMVKDAKMHENASTQIDVPGGIAAKLIQIGKKLIPDEMLAGDGRVTNPHVTIKYGVREDEQTLRQALAGQEPFTITLGKVLVFTPGESSGGASPVVVEAHAKQLNDLHKVIHNAMSARPDDFPYNPHLSIAFVKPEEADQYAGNDMFAGITFPATAVALSMHDDDDQVKILLGKAMAQTAAAPAQPRPEIPQAPLPPNMQERTEPAVKTDEPESQPLTDTEVTKMVNEAFKASPPEPRSVSLPTDTPAFKRWFGNSKVQKNGKPLMVYHGTTHDISKFDPDKGNPDNFYGSALYFTDSQKDVAANYATEEGPDITRRLETYAEQIVDRLRDEYGTMHIENEDKLYEEAYEKARAEIAGPHGGVTMPLYLTLQRPVVVEKKSGTRFQINYNEETGEESGSGVKLMLAVRAVADERNLDSSEIAGGIFEGIGGPDDFTAHDFEEAVRGLDIIEDDEGRIDSGGFVADVYRHMGYDGIIMNAWDEFGGGSEHGTMSMDPGTHHYVVWNPRQVKSAIGNVGTFSRRSPYITAGANEMGLINKIIAEFMPVLGAGLPKPNVKVVNQPRAGWLGRDTWRTWYKEGQTGWSETTDIEVQKSIVANEETLRRVLAHELCHHEQSLTNDLEDLKKMGFGGFRMIYRIKDAHGAEWREIASKFNARFGKDFVTPKSDESYAQEQLELRPYHILLQRQPNGKLLYEVTSRMTTKAKKSIERKLGDPAYRLTTTTDHEFIHGPNIGSWSWAYISSDKPEKAAKLEELWNQAPTTEKTAAVPENLKKLDAPVSKEYDAVKYVWQHFAREGIESMSWKDFQKTFQQLAGKYTSLFTKVRKNKPQVTIQDLKESLDNWKEEGADYGIEYDTYADAETSYRDVEQLVLRINQGASAQRVLAQDPLVERYVNMVGQSSGMSGHPAGVGTVGWLRVDFIDDEWLLVDEVQSDLVNSVTQAKAILTSDTFEDFLQQLGEKARTVALEKISPEQFDAGKRQFLQAGYTTEKLDQIKTQLIELFKDWAEYAVASLLEIARKHGIQKVAIHTAESIAQRDPSVEAGKIKIYYDQLARSMGFQKEQLNTGELQGSFWVRKARSNPTLLNKHELTQPTPR